MTYAQRIAPLDRSKFFQARMAEEELAMLAALADAASLSSSDVVRTLVREAYRLKFGEKKPKPKK